MTNEESAERYWIEIGTDVVRLCSIEAGSPLQTFVGPDRLLAATAELNRLWEREALGAPDIDITGTFSSETTGEAMKDFYAKHPPQSAASKFLTQTLPALARRQRIEGRLAVVREHEAHLASRLADATADHAQAVALREKLEKELSDHLRATETAQNDSGVGQDTPLAPKALSVSEVLAALKRDPMSHPYTLTADYRTDLFKSGPH